MAQVSQADEIELNNFLERRKTLIINLQDSKGLKASGLSAKLLYVRHDSFNGGDVFNLVDGSGSFEYQEFGRAAGKAPPFRKIFEWVGLQKHGIKFKDEKEQKSIAWAILLKIKKEGTYTHIQRNPTRVLEDAISREETNALLRKIAQNRTLEILTDVKRILT